MKKISLIIFTLSLAAVHLQAQQVTVNNELKDLINKSFGYFPKVKEVENTVTTAEQRLELTKLNKMPEVEGVASYNYVRPKIVIPFPMGPNGDLVPFQFAPVHNGNLALQGSYTLFDFGRIKANVERSKDDLQYAKHNVENTKSQLANQVSTIYYNIVFFKKAISIQDSVIAFLNENKKMIDAQIKNGDALKFDLLNIQASIDNAQNQKTDLQNNLEKQYNLLEYTTGLKQNNGSAFDFDVPYADVDGLLGIAQAGNLDFIMAKDKIKQAESDVNVAKLGDKPNVSLGAGAGVKNGYVPDVNNFKFNYSAGVTLSVPIYTGGKTKQQIKIAETQVKQNELAIATLSNTYRRDIEQSLTDIRTNLERIKNTQAQIEQTQYAQKLAAIRFQNGVGTNLELTNASTNVQTAALTKLQYQYQLCLAKVQLANLLGYQYW